MESVNSLKEPLIVKFKLSRKALGLTALNIYKTCIYTINQVKPKADNCNTVKYNCIIRFTFRVQKKLLLIRTTKNCINF